MVRLVLSQAEAVAVERQLNIAQSAMSVTDEDTALFRRVLAKMQRQMKGREGKMDELNQTKQEE